VTTNFVNVFRHFGPNAEKVLLGKLGLKFGKEYFFEYDENYVSSFPNPSPLLLRFAPGIQQEQSSRFPSFLVDSLPDGWGLLLMDKEFRKQGRALREISYIDRLRYVGNNAMGSLSFSPQESEEFIGKSLEIIGIEKLNQNALAIFEEDSHDVLETLNRIASSGGSRPKGNLYFSKDLRLCNESWQPSFDGWIVKFKTHSTVLASEEGVCEYIYAKLAKQAGITLPDTHLFELSDSRLFAIQRFDREDQRRIFSASAANTPTREIFRRMIFNLFSGNQDDHAKNWNFLQDDSGNWSLSPAFDITFSPNPYYEHSTSFKGFEKAPSKEAILNLAKLAGEDKPFAVIKEVVDAVENFPQLAKQYSVKPAAIKEVTKVLNELYNQNKGLLKG
jgi:serine/threonine-protein kinase HipA